MKRKLGIKSSIWLILCRIISWILFLTAVGIPIASYFGGISIMPLSDDEEALLRSTNAFVFAQKMGENPEMYGNIEDVILIEYTEISYSTSYYHNASPKHKLLRIKFKSGNELYVDVQANYSMISSEEFKSYTNAYGKYNYKRNVTEYSSAELKFIKNSVKSGGN